MSKCVLAMLVGVVLVLQSAVAQPSSHQRSVGFAGMVYEGLAPGGSRYLAVSAHGMRVAYGGASFGVVDYLAGARLELPLGSRGVVSAVALSGDGSVAAAYVDRERTVEVWDVDDRSLTSTIVLGERPSDLVFVPLRPWLALALPNSVSLIDLRDTSRARAVSLGRCSQGTLAVSPDGTVLAVGCARPRLLHLVDLNSGLASSLDLEHSPRALAFDAAGEFLALATGHRVQVDDGTQANLQLLDVRSLELSTPITVGDPVSPNLLSSLGWLTDPTLLVAVDHLSFVYLLDPVEPESLTLIGQYSSVGTNLPRASVAVSARRAEVYFGHSGAHGFFVVDMSDSVNEAIEVVAQLRADRVLDDQIAEASRDDVTPVLELVRRGDIAAVRRLLARGLDVNATDEVGVSLLMAAAAAGDFEMISVLLDGDGDVHAVDADGRTALHHAVEADGDLWVAVELIRHGSNPYEPDARGVNAVDLMPLAWVEQLEEHFGESMAVETVETDALLGPEAGSESSSDAFTVSAAAQSGVDGDVVRTSAPQPLSLWRSPHRFGSDLLAQIGSESVHTITVPAHVEGSVASANVLPNGDLGAVFVLDGIGAGTTVMVEMVDPRRSWGMDTYLYLYDLSAGRIIADDDDSPDIHRSEIIFSVESGVRYAVIASSWGGRATGPFVLTVLDPDQPEPDPVPQSVSVPPATDTTTPRALAEERPAVAASEAVTVEFSSDPSGLELSIDGVAYGATPVRVELERGVSVSYRIEGRAPDVHAFEGDLTPQGDVVHPTYLTRYTAEERRAYAAAHAPEPAAQVEPASSPTASQSSVPQQAESQPQSSAEAGAVDEWFAALSTNGAFAPASCPDWALDARACAALRTDWGAAVRALGFGGPPGFRAVGEGSLQRVQDPDGCQGWDTSARRPGCRLMYEFSGSGTVVLVLDRDYLLLHLDSPRAEAELAVAKAARDERLAAEDAGRLSRLDAERRANVGSLDTVGKVRAMTRDLFSRLNYGDRSCAGVSSGARFALCGQTHGDIEVFTQFTETHLMRSAYFDGEIAGPWVRQGRIARLPMRIDGRRVTIVFEGEQGPFQNFGTIAIELHD